MVSLQPALAPEAKKASSCPHLEDFLSKKRKRGRDEEDGHGRNWLVGETKLAKAEEDIDLHLGAPLPLEWQQCLDIQSGEIHFYNTRTHKRTSKDPRLITEPPAAALQHPVSLDLELNLACEPRIRRAEREDNGREDKNGKRCDPRIGGCARADGSRCSSSPWIMSLDADRREMVATVCMRCHMLVMMCKAALSCPNCKFVHPPCHRPPATSPTSIKPSTFNLLCCKD